MGEEVGEDLNHQGEAVEVGEGEVVLNLLVVVEEEAGVQTVRQVVLEGEEVPWEVELEVRVGEGEQHLVVQEVRAVGEVHD